MERYAELDSIFFLKQSDLDNVEEIDPVMATMEIYDTLKSHARVFLPRMDDDELSKFYKTFFDTSIKISKAVKCYYLKATLHGRFWEEMEKVL